MSGSQLEEVRHVTEALQSLEAERSVGPLVEAETVEKECFICLKVEELGKLLALSGMPNGDQTVDPCVRLTFPRTGLAGEGSVGRRIGMIQFRLNSN
jgi:hypothetical protein